MIHQIDTIKSHLYPRLLQALLLAGFRLEEFVMVRVMLDTIGLHDVRVVPLTDALLHALQGQVLHAEEPDWESPRQMHQFPLGAWGSQRACLFSGLSIAKQVREVPELARHLITWSGQ